MLGSIFILFFLIYPDINQGDSAVAWGFSWRSQLSSRFLITPSVLERGPLKLHVRSSSPHNGCKIWKQDKESTHPCNWWTAKPDGWPRVKSELTATKSFELGIIHRLPWWFYLQREQSTWSIMQSCTILALCYSYKQFYHSFRFKIKKKFDLTPTGEKQH